MTIAFYIILFIALYSEIFFLVVFLENRKELAHKNIRREDLKHFPSTTVVVPSYNEEAGLEKTVLSLLDLDYPKDKLEIFIVDDGSTDKTLSVAKKFEKHPQVRIFSKENGGKHTAINLALPHVTTELVGCLDADSYVEKDALLEIVKLFEDEKVKAVTPAIKIGAPESIIQRIQKVEYDISIYLRKMFSLVDAVQVTPGPFSIFRKSVFDELGPYRRAHNTEDMEMALRLHSNHYKIENAHQAIVYTKGPKTFRKLHRQRVRWTYGYLMNTFDYRRLLFNPKYGNIGMIVLPGGIFAIGMAFYFLVAIILKAVATISTKLVQIQTVGIHSTFSVSHFSWLAINTGWSVFISFSLLVLTVFIAFLGRKMSENSWKPSFDMALYLAFYGYIAFSWTVKAVYNTVVARGRESWH